MKYDVEVDNYCDNEQAAGEGGRDREREREKGEENVIKTRDKRTEVNNHENMKCRQRNGAIGSHRQS